MILKLFNGEIYRMLHKKSIYIYFGALAAGYFILAFIRSGGFGDESAVTDAMTMFSLLPALAGGYLFSAIYTDDLNSKNLITLVGYGAGKITIIIVKFALIVLFGALVFTIAPLYHMAVYALLGRPAPGGAASVIYSISLKHFLTATAYSALSGIVVYGLQRTTFAIVTYLLLAFGVIGSLVSIALNTFAPGLTGILVSSITDRILYNMANGGPFIMPVAGYIVYIMIGLALSAAVFFKKEMEF